MILRLSVAVPSHWNGALNIGDVIRPSDSDQPPLQIVVYLVLL